MTGLQIGMYSFDCEDAIRLAGFWSEVTGLPVEAGANAEFAMLGDSVPGPTWMFHRAQARPDGQNRVILDFIGGETYRDEAARLEGHGAELIADRVEDGWGVRWVELHDPEGNLFRIFGPRSG